MNEKQINDYINQLLSLKEIKSRKTFTDDLKKISERVNDGEFRIAVVGEFSSGKSTFINALMKKDLLSHATSETTATITYIKNVKHNDSRIGTCDIKYYNGNVKTVNVKALHDYTTTQSNNSVADTIHSVTVYEHFLNVEEPVVIVDTPGLNGIADKHRDITIDEIKKAHACIYLFQLKGISQSDTEFLSVINNYQSRYIFVQNFIDDLHITEGETIENKLKDDRKNIEYFIQKTNAIIKYDLCGISALKALCAKDNRIKKLYSNSIDELSDDDRTRIWGESKFTEFLSIIEQMMKSGEYRETILLSGEQAIFSLINQLLPTMRSKQELNHELRNSDNRNKVIEKANKEISRIEDNKSSQQKKILSFIDSQKKSYCNGLFEYTEKRLRAEYDSTCSEISRDIPDYDELTLFEGKKNKRVMVYYSDLISNNLNSKIIPDINKRLSNELSHLYDEAIQRIMEYIVVVKNSKLNVQVMDDGKDVVIINPGPSNEVIGLQQQLQDEKEKEKKSNQLYNNASRDLAQTNVTLQKEESELHNYHQNAKQKIDALGRKPEVVRRIEQRTKEVYRGGFFGGIADLFCGPKIVNYTVQVDDDSAQRKWISAYQRIKADQDAYERNKMSQLSHLKYAQSLQKAQADSAQADRAVAEKRICDLEIIIQNKIENDANALKGRKQEVYRTRISQIKKQIENALFFENRNDVSILEKLKRHIEVEADNQTPRIRKKVCSVFNESINAKIKELNEFVIKSNIELEETYKTDNETINVLTNIQNKLTGELKS